MLARCGRDCSSPGLPWHEACPYCAAVTLRITQVEAETGTILRVDGRLEAESLGELERACQEALLPLILNLEGLLWIDDRAAETLRQLRAKGTVVTNASPYVTLRMKNDRNET